MKARSVPSDQGAAAVRGGNLAPERRCRRSSNSLCGTEMENGAKRLFVSSALVMTGIVLSISVPGEAGSSFFAESSQSLSHVLRGSVRAPFELLGRKTLSDSQFGVAQQQRLHSS